MSTSPFLMAISSNGRWWMLVGSMRKPWWTSHRTVSRLAWRAATTRRSSGHCGKCTPVVVRRAIAALEKPPIQSLHCQTFVKSCPKASDSDTATAALCLRPYSPSTRSLGYHLVVQQRAWATRDASICDVSSPSIPTFRRRSLGDAPNQPPRHSGQALQLDIGSSPSSRWPQLRGRDSAHST
jgi:hypothetical protein